MYACSGRCERIPSMRRTSVVITVHNDSEYLPQAIASVIGGKALPLEILVIDDGSRQRMPSEVLESFASGCTRMGVDFQYHFQNNRGPSGARNQGLELAAGDYVAFLDVDDSWLKENLHDKEEVLSALPSNYFGVFGGYVLDPSNPVVFMPVDGRIDNDLVGHEGKVAGGAPQYLFRREALLEIGGFDPELRINEDFDLIIRLGRGTAPYCRGITAPGFRRNLRARSLTRGGDPYAAHAAQSAFLTKAASLDYFSQAELERRSKGQWLTLAARLREGGHSRSEVAVPLERAFAISGPENAREWGAFMLLKILRFPRFGNRGSSQPS